MKAEWRQRSDSHRSVGLVCRTLNFISHPLWTSTPARECPKIKCSYLERTHWDSQLVKHSMNSTILRQNGYEWLIFLGSWDWAQKYDAMSSFGTGCVTNCTLKCVWTYLLGIRIMPAYVHSEFCKCRHKQCPTTRFPYNILLMHLTPRQRLHKSIFDTYRAVMCCSIGREICIGPRWQVIQCRREKTVIIFTFQPSFPSDDLSHYL